MRFGLVHRIMTDALAALGVLALVASGQFGRLTNGAIVIALVLAIGLKESMRQALAKRRVDAVATLALFAVQVGRGMFGAAPVLDLLIEFALGLQIIRVATRKGAAHDQQVIVLALLHLIAGTVVGGGLGYGLCFFGLLVVTPGALVLSHLRREVEGNYRQGARDRTGLPVDVPRILRSKRVVGKQFIAVTCLLSVPILLFTVGLFVVFPRVGLSLLLLNRPKGGRMIGFSGKVDLGQIGTLRADETIALRVTYPDLGDDPPARKVMHLRGTALDHYDGRSWTQSGRATRVIASGGELIAIAETPKPGDHREMKIQLDPIEPPVVFLPRNALGMQVMNTGSLSSGAGTTIQRGPEGELRYSSPHDRGIDYVVYLSPDDKVTHRRLRAGERARYLQSPSDMPARIGELAATWTSGLSDDYAKARIIEKRLSSDFEYDLSSPSGKADQPLDDFLFESKRGHCEYYSTAMAVMLRSQGIPSRNVTGFIGGTYNKYGKFYAVRQGDAHSWVEAYIDGRGWVTFDPTPAGAAVPQSDVDGALAAVRDMYEAISQRWNQNVLGYDLRQQVSLFESVSDKGDSSRGFWRHWRKYLAGAGIALALACAWWLYRRRRRRKGGEAGARVLTKEAEVATRLYVMLDRMMSTVGVARSTTTPPLRHAETLADAEHPLAAEIMSLTERYLEARYGGDPISPVGRKEFESRVRGLSDRAQELKANGHSDDLSPADAAQ